MSQKVIVNLDVAGEQTAVGGTSAGRSKILERLSAVYTFPDGASAGEADSMWADDRTVNAGVVDALELDNLPSVGPVGAVVLAKVKGLVLFNDSDADYLTLGGGSGGKTAPAADAWSDTDGGIDLSPFSADASSIPVAAGDYFLWTSKAGVDVVTANGDILGIEGFVSNQDYQLLIWGDA